MKLQSRLLVLLSICLVLGAPAAAERRVRAARLPAANCKEFKQSIFKPCVCADKVPKAIRFRPSLKNCGGRAAAILSGDYLNSFSVVLRDRQNRDRWPASGYHGCTAAETALGLSKCSAYKCQQVLRLNDGGTPVKVCCFGEKGTSSILKGASRMTIKLSDDPTSSNDPLVRICLNGFSTKNKLN